MGLYVLIVTWLFALMLIGLKSYSTSTYHENRSVINQTDNRIKINKAHLLAGGTLIFLWFLTGFRAETIGNDTKIYIGYFFIFGESGIDPSRTFEYGYQFLNYVIGIFTRDPQIFLITMASILYGGVSICLFKHSKNILISLCLLYCLCFSLFISMFRQSVAMMIAMYGYYQLKKGKKIGAAIIFAIAVLFHTSAVLCFFLLFDTKIYGKRWVVLGTTALIVMFSMLGVFNSIVATVFPRYARYFHGQYASTGWLAVTYDLVRNTAMYLLAQKAADMSKRGDRLILANMTGCLLCGAFGYSVNLFTRCSQYFLLIAVCEIPNIAYALKAKKSKLWLFLICTAMLIMSLLILRFRPDWNHLYPYEFWGGN